jgi:hypothetical protein
MPATTGFGSLRRLVAPFRHFWARLFQRESAWDRLAIRVPPSVFGPGSTHPFAEYFQGQSSVTVKSIDDIVAWLRTCTYVTDDELFHERDVWQHPHSFETLRRGDCEDFALWAWRKLAEIGIDAEFVVGRVLCDDFPEIDRQHAWVVYRVDDMEFLFEPAARDRGRMIQPLVEAMDRYVPYFAVNREFATSAFAGCVLDASRADRHSGVSGRF